MTKQGGGKHANPGTIMPRTGAREIPGDKNVLSPLFRELQPEHSNTTNSFQLSEGTQVTLSCLSYAGSLSQLCCLRFTSLPTELLFDAMKILFGAISGEHAHNCLPYAWSDSICP